MPDAGPFVARRARADDAAEVERILHAAAHGLVLEGWRNWDPPYPRERIAADVAEREVYLVDRLAGGAQSLGSSSGTSSGTFTLGATATRPYDPAPWDVATPALYLNRLAVDPAAAGCGVGGWCLDEIARLAQARRVQAVRCDVLDANTRLRALYERHGYVRRGVRSHSGWTFASYERALPPPVPAP